MVSPELTALRDEAVARLHGLPGLRSKGMFGGYGLWAEDGLFFGIVWDGRVFFRTDGETRSEYAERGSVGFIYAEGEPPSETYLSVPDDVYADPATLMAWAEDALDAARRAKTSGRRRGGSGGRT